jgi:predicted DNA-binding transcriptional regulator AlpA
MTIQDVKKFFTISDATVYRWCQRGMLKPRHLTTGTVRFLRRDVLALVERQPGDRMPHRDDPSMG